MYNVLRHFTIFVFLCPALLFAQSFIQDSLHDISDRRISEHETFAYSIYIVNDNYIARWLPGEKGHYFGADDFLTGSLLANIYWKNWQHNITYNTLTLRKINIRYDLLSVQSSYQERFDNYILSGGLGLIYKGQLGGDFFQNGYHKFRAIKRVNIPYSQNKGLAIILSTELKWFRENILLSKDIFRFSIETKIYSNHVASRISPGISYQAGFWENKLQTELMLAYRTYLNQEEDYSKFVRVGISYGMNFKINVCNEYFLDIGFITIPSRNIESDPMYPKYKNNYLPQAWIGFSWNTQWHSIADFFTY